MRLGCGDPGRGFIMNLMRYTIVDEGGTVSFVADCNSLYVMVAACAANPKSLDQMLAFTERFDKRLKEYVSSGLAIFDEYNCNGNYERIHAAFKYCMPHEVPVFRVVDERTRQVSLQSLQAGIIVFNLAKRRIIQIQNSFAEIRRKGRVRIHDGSRLTNQVYAYELPNEWSLVPS